MKRSIFTAREQLAVKAFPLNRFCLFGTEINVDRLGQESCANAALEKLERLARQRKRRLDSPEQLACLKKHIEKDVLTLFKLERATNQNKTEIMSCWTKLKKHEMCACTFYVVLLSAVSTRCFFSFEE